MIVDTIAIFYLSDVIDDKVIPAEINSSIQFPFLPQLWVFSYIQWNLDAVFLMYGNAGKRQGQRAMDRLGDFISPVPYASQLYCRTNIIP